MTGHLLHSFEPIDPMTASAGYLATSSAVNPPSCNARSCVASSTTRGMISSPSGWVAAAFTASYHRRAHRHHTHGVVAWGAVVEGESCLRREGKRGQRSLPRPAIFRSHASKSGSGVAAAKVCQQEPKGWGRDALFEKSRKVGVTTAATVCEPGSCGLASQ